MSDPSTSRDDRIRNRAYELWERDGKPDDRADDYWHQAVAEIDGVESEAADGFLEHMRGRWGSQRDPDAAPGQANQVVYEIVEHDGGWAYRVNGSYSETFASHAAATEAATRAAAEQQVGDETDDIAYQDEQGVFHEETARGNDRPTTAVRDR